MSKILPVILLVGGLYYFSTTASGESPVEGCMADTAENYNPDATVDDGSCNGGTNGNGNGNGNGGDDEEITPLPGCPPLGERKEWSSIKISPYYHYRNKDSLNGIRISEVATNQNNYYPGTQVDITWEAEVKNKSKSRCGEGILGGDKTCWFAPTGGSAIGANEGPLNWTIFLIGPDGNQIDSVPESGSNLFQGYTDSNVDDANLSDLKGVAAKYQTAFSLPANASPGHYAIRFYANYGDDGNEAFWNQIAAFKVLPSECNPDTMSAESEKINYETRFASNHDFMLF